MSIRDSHHRGISFENTTQCLPTQHRLGRSGSRGRDGYQEVCRVSPCKKRQKRSGVADVQEILLDAAPAAVEGWLGLQL